MKLHLMEVVEGIKEIQREYVLAAFKFSGRGPKSKAPYVEVYANETDRRPMEDILAEYEPVERSLAEAVNQYEDGQIVSRNLTVTVHELFPTTMRLYPGQEPMSHDFYLNLKKKTGEGPSLLDRELDVEGIKQIVALFTQNGWTLTEKVDNTLIGPIRTGRNLKPDTRYR